MLEPELWPFKNPSDFPYEISSVTEESTHLASNCEQSQPSLKSAPPSDESQPHEHSNEKKNDVHATIFSVSRHIIQFDLFARALLKLQSEM